MHTVYSHAWLREDRLTSSGTLTFDPIPPHHVHLNYDRVEKPVHDNNLKDSGTLTFDPIPPHYVHLNYDRVEQTVHDNCLKDTGTPKSARSFSKKKC